MKRALVICLAAALAACGSDDDDNGGGGGGGATAVTVTGPLATQATNAAAVMGTAPCTLGGFTLEANFLAIGASSYPQLCSLAQTGDEKANDTFVNIAIATLASLGSAAPITAGTYTVGTTSTQFVTVFVSRNDAACTETDESADSGTVTISSIQNGTVNGSLDVSISGGRITGTFSAPPCAVTGITDVCSDTGLPDSDVCRP
jgi:hypothetical protein